MDYYCKKKEWPVCALDPGSSICYNQIIAIKMKTPVNVLLTGASGTIGYEVLRQVVPQDNCKLTVFDKETQQAKKLFAPYKDRINVVYGDLSNEDDLARMGAGFDVAIHLAAIIPPLSDEKPELARKVNVGGTRNVIEFLQKTSPNAFLLFSSSIAVYGDHVLEPNISVLSPLNALKEDVYAQSKIESESLIRNSGLDWCIFRLTAIMKNHKMSKLMFHMPLSTRMEICTASDTARVFVEAINHRMELAQQVFNLGGGSQCYITYREFLERSFHAFGLGKLNFPEHAFAERNFHCGIYVDGDRLEEILHFRRDTVDSYFADVNRSVPFAKRLASSLFGPLIKQGLLVQSEPYKAYKTKNQSRMNLFFFPENKQVSAVRP
jgi:nucleoside-diphosphate-sugar epimerase